MDLCKVCGTSSRFIITRVICGDRSRQCIDCQGEPLTIGGAQEFQQPGIAVSSLKDFCERMQGGSGLRAPTMGRAPKTLWKPLDSRLSKVVFRILIDCVF